jgi:outer membrane protein insertion porin family
MRNKITLLLLLLGFAGTAQNYHVQNYDVPKKYILGGVKMEGAMYLDTNILIYNIAGLLPGQTINMPGEEISHAIDNLWKQRFFSDIQVLITRIEPIPFDSLFGNLTILEKIYLTIKVVERPRLSKYSITGLKKNQAKNLKEDVKIKSGDIVNDYLKSKALQNIKSYFVGKGFSNVKVNVTELNDTLARNSSILVFNVDRGDKVRIGKVEFFGNTHISSAKLCRTLKETKKYRWYFFQPGKYKENEFQDDKEKIELKYNNLGYRDAKVKSDTIFNITPDRIAIQIHIEEGKQYHFRKISWIGNTKYTVEQLNQILGIHTGDIYNQSLLDKKLTYNEGGLDVSSVYMDDGYLFFNITPVEVLVENDSIDLELRIYEGKQAIINNITIKGNTKTSDHVILREIRSKPGDKFSRSNIIRSQRELSQMGIFDPEKGNVIPTPHPETGTVDIEYIVEEKPSDQIELQGGWGGGYIVGTLGLTLNNFSANKMFKKGEWSPIPSGDAERLSIRAQSSGAYYSSFNASFNEPWLGGKHPNNFSISTYYTILSSDYKKYSDPTKSLMKIIGGSIGLGKRLKWPDDFFTINHALTYQVYNLSNYQLISVKNKAGYTEVFNNGVSHNLNYKATIARNSIDNPIFPTSGSNFSLSMLLTPPYSLFGEDKNYETNTLSQRNKLVEYHKWRFDAQWFTPLPLKFVLYAKASFGFMGSYNKKYDVPPFDRYVMGGSELTGYSNFNTEPIGMRGYADKSLTNSYEAHNGGSTIFDRYTLELRYPITTGQAATVYALGFAEAGKPFNTFKFYNPFDLYRSAGVGVKVYLPMLGLLGLDWGYGFDNPKGVQKGNFHFSIGQAF